MTNEKTEKLRKKLLSPEYYLNASRECLKRRNYGGAWCFLEFAKNVGHSAENPRTAECSARLEGNIWERMKAEFLEIALKYNLDITYDLDVSSENNQAIFKEHSPSWTRYTEVRDRLFGLAREIREESK